MLTHIFYPVETKPGICADINALTFKRKTKHKYCSKKIGEQYLPTIPKKRKILVVCEDTL